MLTLLVLLKEDFIFLQLDFHGAAVEIEVVHHRTARWDKDSHAESQARRSSQQASQAETAGEPVLYYWLAEHQSGNVKSSYNVRPI